MLYDPKWGVPIETKPTEPTLAGFVAWLDTKDSHEKYYWFNGSNCAVAQYAHSVGLKRSYLLRWVDTDGLGKIWGQLDWIAQRGRHSFGAVARRAKWKLFWCRAWCPIADK